MFDIDLDCDGRVQSQMCAFVIKQVRVFHLREHTGERADLPMKSLCFTLVFHATEPQTSMFPSSLHPLHSPHPLTTSFCWDVVLLICILLKKKKKHEFIEGSGGAVCLWIALGQVLSHCLIQLLGGNGQTFKQMPAALIRALPQPFSLLPSDSGEYIPELDFKGCYS